MLPWLSDWRCQQLDVSSLGVDSVVCLPPLPAHQGTWKETESTVCYLVVTRDVNQRRITKTAVETNTLSSNRQGLLIHRIQLYKTKQYPLLSIIHQCYPLCTVNKTSLILAIRYPSSLEKPEMVESMQMQLLHIGVPQSFVLVILIFFLSSFPYFNTCFSCLFSKSLQRYSPQLLHLLSFCLQALKSHWSIFCLWFTSLSQFWVTQAKGHTCQLLQAALTTSGLHM